MDDFPEFRVRRFRLLHVQERKTMHASKARILISRDEEYKPWKEGATARYYASHTKIMLPTRKSVPRSSRQSDHITPDYCQKTRTAVVWSCLPFIRSGQNHHSEKGKMTRQTGNEMGRQHQGMDRPGVWQVQEGSWE